MNRTWRLASIGIIALAMGVAFLSGGGRGDALKEQSAHYLRTRTAAGQGCPDAEDGGSQGASGQQRTSRTRTGSNLYSHGGPVTVTPMVYISYWGSEWATTANWGGGYTNTQAQAYINGFFGNVGGSSWINSTTQYCQNVPSGSTSCNVTGAVKITNPAAQLGATWNDTTTVPSQPSQTDINNAAARLAQHMAANGVPISTNAIYVVFTPHGKSQSGFGTQWCAYHSSTTTSNITFGFAYVPYQPDAGSACGMNFVNATNNSFGNGYFDGFSIVGGHEYGEAETDILPASGWLDSRGSENGDKCAWSSSSTDVTLGGNAYAVQPLWSNATSSCVTSY